MLLVFATTWLVEVIVVGCSFDCMWLKPVSHCCNWTQL